MTSNAIWIERLSSLHRHILKKFASDEGLQLVHVEVLHYLDFCNKYSNTTQAISDYLGQTKGSLSQSLNHMLREGLIDRRQDVTDGRVFHISATPKGGSVVARLKLRTEIDFQENEATQVFQSVLVGLQKKNGMKGFGICSSCRFHQQLNKQSFRCDLTNEILAHESGEKLCREFEA